MYLSSIYTGIWIGSQSKGKSFFCQPRALPNETLPAHSAAEIAGRVHFVRVSFSSPTFSSLFMSPNTTLHCWSFQWRLPGEIRYNGLKYLLCAGCLRDAGSRLLLFGARRGWGDLRVAGTEPLGSLKDRWGSCRSCPCPHLTCVDPWETERERKSGFSWKFFSPGQATETRWQERWKSLKLS